MKSSCIIIILCIFGYISNLEAGQSAIYDIQYSSEYEVNVKDFTEGYIPYSTKLYFRLKINPNDKMAITLKTLQSDSYSFSSLDVYEFSQKPSDEQAKQHSGSSQWLHSEEKRKSGNYISGIYPFEDFWSTDTTYVVIYLDIYDDLHYLSILVSSYKEKSKMFSKELSYNEEFEMDSNTLSNTETYFLFYLDAKNRDNEAIIIKLYKDEEPNFMINLVGLKTKSLIPSQSDMIDTRSFLAPESNTTDSKYSIYKYGYSKLKDDVVFLYIQIFSDYSYNYFSICVGDSCGSSSVSVLLIILIVFICLVVVGIAAFFVLRKLGYINFGKSTSSKI